MKRTEMVDEIRNSLHWMNTSFANKVLDVIERAGMLPPKRLLTREEYPLLTDDEYYKYCDGYSESRWSEE